MEIIAYILIGAVLGAVMIRFFVRKDSGPAAEDTRSLLMIQQQMNDLAKQLDSKLTESRRDMTDAVRTQFSESQKTSPGDQ